MREVRPTTLVSPQMTGMIPTIIIPNEIETLTKLQFVWLIYNSELTSLPNEIGNLTQLTYLDLSNNQLISIPIQIGNLTQICIFISLQSFHMF